ncbi:MAG TPA: two-component regulator propeller domain-containing protein, partial [Flavobacteriales bacterium]|nr:two-component regulator propeller domain-containing protein [Flavobacteriales bacterium]
MKPDQLHLRYFFCLVFLWCSTQSYAQSARFKQLTVDDGLLQNSVGSINQDKAGYIWIATGAGINMYDGYDFKSFRHKPNDPGSLSANEITFVFPDSKNNLWIGTRYNGVNRMDLKTHKITRLKSDEKGNGNYNAAGAFCILEDKNGFIYIGGNNGLNIYNPSTKK